MNTTTLAVGTAMHLAANETTATGGQLLVWLGIMFMLLIVATWR